jgi:cytochrome c biogenesis protein CcmG/thiol:disulfide interchange protein DsbE
VREHPELVKFAQAESGQDEPAEIYTVINDDSDTAVRAFFDENGGDWPKVKDDNGTIAVAFGVAKVPETWIVDPNGFVRMRITGEISTDFLNETMSNFRLQASGGG